MEKMLKSKKPMIRGKQPHKMLRNCRVVNVMEI